jgi:protein-disulfide isomerase
VPNRRTVVLGGIGAALFGVAGWNTLSNGSLTDAGEEQPDEDAPSISGVSIPDVRLYATAATTPFGLDLAGTPLVGADDAEVNIYYWGDYQCPFCKRFEQNAFHELARKQIADGTVRMALFQYPNIGEASVTAGALSRAVWRVAREENPQAFLRWHSAVFDIQEKPNSGWASVDALLSVARQVSGVDAAAVERTYTDNERVLKSAIDDEKSQGRARGIDATPGFLLHSPKTGSMVTITGAQPYERFEAEIEAVRER